LHGELLRAVLGQQLEEGPDRREFLREGCISTSAFRNFRVKPYKDSACTRSKSLLWRSFVAFAAEMIRN